jgi:hypothetical protein
MKKLIYKVLFMKVNNYIHMLLYWESLKFR